MYRSNLALIGDIRICKRIAVKLGEELSMRILYMDDYVEYMLANTRQNALKLGATSADWDKVRRELAGKLKDYSEVIIVSAPDVSDILKDFCYTFVFGEGVGDLVIDAKNKHTDSVVRQIKDFLCDVAKCH